LAVLKEAAVLLFAEWAARQPAAALDVSDEIDDAVHAALSRIEDELVGDGLSDDEACELALLPEVWAHVDVQGMGTTPRGLARRGFGWAVTQAAYDWLRAHQPQAAS
jgi:hypothetical protein